MLKINWFFLNYFDVFVNVAKVRVLEFDFHVSKNAFAVDICFKCYNKLKIIGLNSSTRVDEIVFVLVESSRIIFHSKQF